MKSYIRPENFEEFIDAYNDHVNKDSIRNNNGLKTYFIIISLFSWAIIYFFSISNLYFFSFALIISIIALLMKYRKEE